MPDTYSSRLLERTRLLAKLMDQLVADDVTTIEKLAQDAGVTRSVMTHFLNGYRKTEAKGDVSVKVAVLAKFMDWFEQTNFSSDRYNEGHRALVYSIAGTMMKGEGDAVYRNLAEGFVHSPNSLRDLENTIGGYYLGLRARGSFKLIQTLAIKFFVENTSPYLQWHMEFSAGDGPTGGGRLAISSLQKRTRLVKGYVAKQDNVISCIGRRDDTDEMHVLYLMLKDQTANLQDRLRGLYVSFSHGEAIARAMVLIKQPEISDHNAYEINSLVGDFEDEEILKNTDWFAKEGHDISDLHKGLSVSPDAFEQIYRPTLVTEQL